MDDSFLLMVVAGQVVMTLLAWVIGAGRGRGAAGFFCGFLLGPLGVVLAFFLPEGKAKQQARRPGSPVKRDRRMPLRPDPLEEFEAAERRRTGGK